MSLTSSITQGLINTAAGIGVNYLINPKNAYTSYYPYIALTTAASIGCALYYFQNHLPDGKIKQIVAKTIDTIKNNQDGVIAIATGSIIGGIYQGIGTATIAFAIGTARMLESIRKNQPTIELLQKKIAESNQEIKKLKDDNSSLHQDLREISKRYSVILEEQERSKTKTVQEDYKKGIFELF